MFFPNIRLVRNIYNKDKLPGCEFVIYFSIQDAVFIGFIDEQEQ
jgi:hypothetical protein